MNPYDRLQYAYDRALNVCDSIEFMNRRDNLLLEISAYLLEKDRPEEKESHATD